MDPELEDHECLLTVEKHLDLAEIELCNAVKAAIEADLDLDIIHCITKAYYPIKDAQHMVLWRSTSIDQEA